MMESILFAKNNSTVCISILILHYFQLIYLVLADTPLMTESDSIVNYFCSIIKVFLYKLLNNSILVFNFYPFHKKL